MPGMGGAPGLGHSSVVRAFHAALGHEFLIVLALAALVLLGGYVLRGVELRRMVAGAGEPATTESSSTPGEPAARRLLRIGFGLFWVLDGLLQSQSAMPVAMPSQVIAPSADASPAWVQHLVSFATATWSAHPVPAAVGVVWIQCGIGAWLLLAPPGRLSRLAGGASACWALVVFVFGESFGAMLAPGASWLFGAPGAAVFYGVAGVLLALPEARLRGSATWRKLLRGIGALFVAMAVLQAWPGRGFWRDHGTLFAMASSMAATPQPHLVAAWLRDFALVAGTQAAELNGLGVALLAAIGVGLLVARAGPLRAAVVVSGVFGLVVWVFVQDFGVLGGLGTDPNSIPPELVLIAAGSLAVLRPATRAIAAAPTGESGARASWTRRLSASPSYGFRTLAALAALLVVLLGAIPIAVASTLERGSASAMVRQATRGSPQITDVRAPHVDLVDQNGTRVTLAALGGKVVLLTFLDPLGRGQSPAIARELRQVSGRVHAAGRHISLVAINDDARHRARGALRGFDQRMHLSGETAWRFLSGSLPALRETWARFGVAAQIAAPAGMAARRDVIWGSMRAASAPCSPPNPSRRHRLAGHHSNVPSPRSSATCSPERAPGAPWQRRRHPRRGDAPLARGHCDARCSLRGGPSRPPSRRGEVVVP